MEITKQQKEILSSLLLKTQSELDMDTGMEFGSDIAELIIKVDNEKVK